MIAWLARRFLIVLAHVLTGARGIWSGCAPAEVQRVYYGNHSSHGDFLIIWAALPPTIRRRTRPVAGADYWLKGAIRSFVARRVIRAVLIERAGSERTEDPIRVLMAAVDAGSSLIVFPEGTRNMTEDRLLPFKSGIYRLALERPKLEFVPVWVENLSRVMPKGEFVPIPLLCTATFGAPILLEDGESKANFVSRARDALLALAPKRNS